MVQLTSPEKTEVFVSYARPDAQAVHAVADALAQAGASVWLDVHRIHGCTLWPEQISRAIQACRVVLLMVSAHAFRSHYVKQEVLLAGEYQKRVVPVILPAIGQTLSIMEFPEAWQLFLGARSRLRPKSLEAFLRKCLLCQGLRQISPA